MKITIITPCYNAEDFITKTIDSVINQSGDFEIEYIIVDGNSKDNTLAIINSYKNNWSLNSNSEIIVLSEKDNGMYDALSKGFKLSTGEIITYINADDILMPNALSTIADIFKTNADVKWVTCGNLNINEKGEIINFRLPLNYDKDLVLKGYYGKKLPFIQQEGTFWKKEIMDKVDLDVLKSFKYAGDYYIWHCFSKYYSLYIIQTFLAGFRIRKGQLSENLALYFNEYNKICDKPTIISEIKFLYYSIFIFLENFVRSRLKKNFIYYTEIWRLYER
jgi:glycosyltransferase involved in cell wall biosynthesis